MKKKLTWRVLVALIAVFASLIYITPSFMENLPAWWLKILPKDKISLGLDLQGGMHLTLDVKVSKAVENHVERVVEELKQGLRSEKLRYKRMERSGSDGISVVLMRDEDRAVFEKLIRSFTDSFKLTYTGRDGTVSYNMILEDREVKRVERMAVDQALETIRNRIDQFGVSEPDIRPQQGNRILVQLPGVKDAQRAVNIINKTALLEFKLVDEDNNLEEALKGNVPAGSKVYYEISGGPGTSLPERKTPYLLKDRTVLTGEYITDGRVKFSQQFNEPYVSLSFNSMGAKIFERVTGDNIKKRLAIVLDGNVYSAPVIQDKIAGGEAQITGRFSVEEARDLAIVLRAGSLPAPVVVIEERTVGPSLGKDSIERGIKSMIIGGAVVIIFMILYYGLSGLIADIALLFNVVFILASLAAFNATLTLPGIAGIVLTIGMAVDANVLIFERIREEIRSGQSMVAAVDNGYKKALVTILDANITSLIVALVLFQFGTGPVRGFAVTLSVGIISSLFTAIFLTRIAFDYIYVNKKLKKISI